MLTVATFFKRLALILFGVVLALVLVEITSAILYSSGFRLGYSLAAPVDKFPGRYKYEISSKIKPTESGFRIPNSRKFDLADYLENSPHYSQDDDIYFATPNYSGYATFTRKTDGKVIYQSLTRTDAHHRRWTHDPTEKEIRSKHLLLMGCSYVWGEWLPDSETVGWKLQHRQNEFSTYNLGFSGYNPSLTYRMMERYGYLDEIEPKDGVAFYLTMSFHIDRMAGITELLGKTNYPYYEFSTKDSQDDLHFVGHKEFRSHWKPRLQSLYAKSFFYRVFHLELPVRTQETYRQFALMLQRIEKSYYQKFKGNNKFYVVLYPHGFKPKEARKLKVELEKLQISFIDLSNETYFYQEPDTELFLIDGHPGPKLNEKVSEVLSRYLHE